MEAKAEKKKHCTISEALSVVQKMQPTTTVLTHFSQRYPKMPSISSFASNVSLAFDLMKVKFSWANKLVSIIPTISTFYDDVQKQKAEERQERSNIQMSEMLKKRKINLPQEREIKNRRVE